MTRVEILAGRERRRFWSAEQKRAILDEAAASSLTMAEVARRHDVVPQQIYTWRRQLGLNASAVSAPTFLPVILAASENAAAERYPFGGGRLPLRSDLAERFDLPCWAG